MNELMIERTNDTATAWHVQKEKEIDLWIYRPQLAVLRATTPALLLYFIFIFIWMMI